MFVDGAAMSGLGPAMASVGHRFTSAVEPVRALAEDAMVGAGEFGSSLGEGAATFAVSWTSALGAYAHSCRLLAAHVDRADLQLGRLDAQLAGSPPGR